MTNGEKSPDVKRILKLGEKTIPLLIKHLDDRRYFKCLTFCRIATQHTPVKVQVGKVALDILTVIGRRGRPMFDSKCVEEPATEDRCVSENYDEGKTGGRNWQKAYRAGKVRYRKPDYGSSQ